MLAETPVTQHSPCYSAVSASLMNPLPDCSNYSPFCHTHHLTLWPDQYFTSLAGQTLYQAAPLENNTSLLQRFTRIWNSCLRRSTCSALRKLNNKQSLPQCHLATVSFTCYYLVKTSVCATSTHPPPNKEQVLL